MPLDMRAFGLLMLMMVGVWIMYAQQSDVVWRRAVPSGDVVAFSPDGQWVAVACEGDQVALYRRTNLQLERMLSDHLSPVISIAFSPNSQQVATLDMDGKLMVWQVATGVRVRNINAHSTGGRVVCFSPDGTLIATGGWDGTVRLWNASTGAPVRTLMGHSNGVFSVAFSSNSQTVAVGDGNGNIRLWQVSNGNQIATLSSAHFGEVSALAWAPTGNRFASGGTDGTIKIWSQQGGTWQTERTIEGAHLLTISGLAYRSDGIQLFSASWDGTIKVWNPANGSAIRTIDAHRDGVNGFSALADGTQIVSIGIDRRVRFWNPQTGESTASLPEHTEPIKGVGFAGSILVSVDLGGGIKRWFASDGTFEDDLPAHNDFVFSARVSPDGNYLVLGDLNGQVIVRGLPNGNTIATWQAHTDAVLDIAFSADGSLVATASADGTAKVWSLPAGTLQGTLMPHNGTVNAVAMSSNGAYIATGDALGNVRVWNANDGTLQYTLTGHTEAITDLAFQPNSALLASSSLDGTVRLWNAETGAPQGIINAHLDVGVSQVLFSRSGTTIISAGFDGTLRFWNLAGTLQRQVNALRSPIHALALSPDTEGQWLAVASDEGLVVVWTFGPPNRPPDVPQLVSPNNGATVGRTPTLTVRVSDPDNNQVRALIEITTPDNQVRNFETNLANSGTNVSVSIPSDQPLTPGQYQWRARAQDNQGLFSDWSATRTFTVSNGAPGKPEILEPANNISVSPTPTFRLRLSDADGDRVRAVIEIYQGNTRLHEFTTEPVESGSEVQFSLPEGNALEAGTYQWRTRARDEYGAESDWTDMRQFTVPAENQPPALPERLSPSDRATVSTRPTFTLRLSDPDNDQVKAQIEIRSTSTGTTQTFETAFVNSRGEVSLTLNEPLGEGTYTWRARAQDSVGAFSEWTAYWEFQVSATNRAPSSPTLIAPADGAEITGAVTFRLSLSDPDGDRLSGTIELTLPDDTSRTFTTQEVTSGDEASFTLDEALAPGVYRWRARGVDGRGAQGDWSSVRTFTVPQPNRAPNIPELISPANDATTSRTPIFRVRADDPDEEQVRFEIEVRQGTQVVQQFTTDYVASGATLVYPVPDNRALPVDTFSWRVRAQDVRGTYSEWSQPRSLRTAQEVQPTLIGTRGFALSLQVSDSSPNALGLSNAQVVRWNPTSQAYETVAQLQIGEGYFVKVPSTVRLDLSGQPITSPTEISLQPGWNLIASPYLTNLLWNVDTIRVKRGDQTLTLRGAQQAGWLDDYLWSWRQDPQNPSQGAYELVYDANLLPSVNGALEPWRAYWILASEPCTLVLNPATRSTSRSRAPDNHSWNLRIQAWGEGGHSEVVLGAGRALLASPPPTAFTNERAPQILLRRAEGYFSADLRAEVSRSTRWQVEVRVPPANAPQAITLHIPNALQLPRSVQLVLIDEQTGVRMPVRTRANYTFNAPPSGGVYTFNIEPMAVRALLRVLNPTVHGGRSRGEPFQIGFSLTAPAQVQVAIRSGARTVRTLTANTNRSAGYQQLVWDGRDDRGIALPPGQYMVEVVATSEDGQVARAVIPLISTR